MSESFVYCWTNHTNNKLYVGYHKGSVDDGYVCSSLSESFWSDFKNPEMKWSRQVIAHGSTEECIKLETKILQGLNLKEHYNNAAGQAVVFTDEVRQKLRDHWKRNGGGSNLGKKFSEETKTKMSKARLGKVDPEETRRRKSEAAKRRWALQKGITNVK